MKFIALAALVCMAEGSKLNYAESEGPTKVDLGENDHEVLPREDVEESGWTNPLSVADTGDDDEVVVTMVDGSLVSTKQLRQKLHQKHHSHHKKASPMRPIYDADGDGVEDNVHKTHDELDRFYDPAVFRTADDLYNTHHGNLPGHVRKAEEDIKPEGHYSDKFTSFHQHKKHYH